MKLKKSKVLRCFVAYVVFYAIMTLLTSLSRVGIFTSTFVLRTDGYSLVAHDMEYNVDQILTRAGHDGGPPPMPFKLENDQINVVHEDKTLQHAASGAMNAVWSTKYSKLFFSCRNEPTSDQDGLWCWDEANGFKLVAASKQNFDELSLSLDGEDVVAPSIPGADASRLYLLTYHINTRQVGRVVIPFAHSISVVVLGNDNFVLTSFDTEEIHSFLTNGAGLAYHWSSKFEDWKQLDINGTIVSAVAFRGSVWGLRQTRAWKIYPWWSVRDHDNIEVVRLNSTLDKVEEVFQL